MSSVNVQALLYRFKILFARSGSNLVRALSDASRFAESVVLIPAGSGKLCVDAFLEGLPLLEPGFSVPGKRLSGIWTPQLHIITRDDVHMDLIYLFGGGLHENPCLPKQT